MRRTQNACRPCRRSKIKCSGDHPCSNCRRRLVNCVFEDENVRVMVSRRYLHDIQKQLRDLQQRSVPQTTPTSTAVSDAGSLADTAMNQEESEDTPLPQTQSIPQSVWTSPFEVPSSVARRTGNDRFDWVWLAPSSIFSFYDRLGLLMTERLGLDPPSFREDSVYPLQWTVAPANAPLDVSGLPSIDHALFLFNTVKFNFSQVYRLFEEEVFVGRMREFYYGNGLEEASRNRLWLVQFLLMLAFGKAFLDHPRTLTVIPGAEFFCRAMSLMPDLTSIWKSGVAAIEVLALAGLYLHCIDHRQSAHLYIGQAIRIAMMEGLHTQLPEEQLGKDTVDQCRNLWWTLYILDRRFSSGLGIPVIVHDNDIATLPTPLTSATQEDATLCLRVRLWQIMSHILSTVYKTDKIQLGKFLEMTRSILKSLADHAQEIEKTIELKFHSSIGRLPKGTRLVTLTYHQCVIFATRPLLLSILKERLDNMGQSDEVWQDFLALTATLISTGIKSASSMLQILSCEGDLLEVFFLNDLDFVYGASLFLTMATALFPKEAEGRNYREEAHAILDDMIGKGNRVAEARKKDLVYLEYLFDRFTHRFNEEGAAALTLFDSEDMESMLIPEEADNSINGRGQGSQLTPNSAEIQQQLLPLDPGPSLGVDLLGSMGISSYDFYSIVDEIGPQNGF